MKNAISTHLSSCFQKEQRKELFPGPSEVSRFGWTSAVIFVTLKCGPENLIKNVTEWQTQQLPIFCPSLISYQFMLCTVACFQI